MATSFDIEVPRQGDWLRDLVLLGASDIPVDLSACRITWDARVAPGPEGVVGTAKIFIIDAEAGEIQVRWHGPDFDGFGLVTEIVRVAHELKIVDSRGLVDIPLSGRLILFPGVTS